MKKEEHIAEQYFKSKGFEHITYEPDGNIPPDFLLDNQIAVEVRRLNQHLKLKGESAPLEDLEFDLIPRFIRLLKSYENHVFERSSFVNIEFSRPIPSSKEVVKKIKSTLDEHLNKITETRSYQITKNVKIEVFPASNRLSSPFNLGIQSDNDSGGFVVGNIYESLKLIVAEKHRKIEPYRNRYNRWWLALVDYIGFGIDQNDVSQLKETLDFSYAFERIIFISPIAPSEGVEIVR